MALMELLKQNFLNTTTMVTCDSGTGTVSALFDRNPAVDYNTDGYGSNTSTILSVVFDAPTVVSNVSMQNINLKNFRIFYDSTTANSLAVVSQNSHTSYYLSFASVTVNSINIQMDSAMAADTEKSIGELIVTERRVQFERNPSANNYNPELKKTRVKHVMPDGGVSIYYIADKFKTTLKWKYVTDTFRETLYDVFAEALPLYFIPFPTATSWDGRAYEVVWTNDFDFTYDENSKTQGQGGAITLEETAGI